MTASLLKSPGLFSVFWTFSIILLFGWSPLGRQLLNLPGPLITFSYRAKGTNHNWYNCHLHVPLLSLLLLFLSFFLCCASLSISTFYSLFSSTFKKAFPRNIYTINTISIYRSSSCKLNHHDQKIRQTLVGDIRTAVLALLGFISSVYRDLPHWRSNQRPQNA